MKSNWKMWVIIVSIILCLSSVNLSNSEKTFSYGGKMVLVYARIFQMGNSGDDIDEKPFHKVELTYDYEIGKYELTNAKFLEFLNGAEVPSDGQLNGHEVVDMGSLHCEFDYSDGRLGLRIARTK